MAGILLNRPRNTNTGIVPPNFPTSTSGYQVPQGTSSQDSGYAYSSPNSLSAAEMAQRGLRQSTVSDTGYHYVSTGGGGGGSSAPASSGVTSTATTTPHVPPAASGTTAPTPAPATPPPSGGGGGTVATGATSAVNGLATSGTDYMTGMSQPPEQPEMVSAMEGLLRQGMGERTYPDQSRRLQARIY